MKRFPLHLGTILTIVMMFINMGVPYIPVYAQEPVDYLPDEIVVKLFQAAGLADVASDYNLDPIPLDQFGTRAIYLMRITDGASPLDRAAELQADPRIVYAEPNFIGRAPEGQQRVSWAKGDESVRYEEQWAASMIRLPEAHTVTRGSGVTVAVLDTGVDLSHPALAGRLVSGFDFVDMDALPSEVSTSGYSTVYGHGTHVAGLIALVAPEAKIMPVRVLDEEGVGNIWVLAEAMAYAVNPDGDINTNDGADVINLSLSTDYPTNLLAEVEDDVTCSDDDQDEDDEGCLTAPSQHGAVVVAAAGNGGSSMPEYPAGETVPGLLAVGASTATDTLAVFSNYGSWVHVIAPGENIFSSVPGGEYAFWSGTSMSTPLVAGEAALVRAFDPGLDAANVTKRIMETSAKVNGPVPLRIDTAAALGIPLPTISGEYNCSGTLGPANVDNLLVPKDATCTLVGTRISGNIKVEEGGILNASGVYVKGSVQAKGAESIQIIGSTIDGSVQVEEGYSARLEDSHVNGSAEFLKNTADITVLNNTLQGNLVCKENNLMPTGGGNIVQGNKEEQCSGL